MNPGSRETFKARVKRVLSKMVFDKGKVEVRPEIYLSIAVSFIILSMGTHHITWIESLLFLHTLWHLYNAPKISSTDLQNST